METPICDFVQHYVTQKTLRLHMPGHKGKPFLGIEETDITEIDGADSLYEADGIIRQSEENASLLFGCKTLYSTEGSSLCIRAMLYLISLFGSENGARPRVVAGRNAHKTFLSAAALLDLDVDWLCPAEGASYLTCAVQPQALETYLTSCEKRPAAVYLTSPDYLGNTVDLAEIAEVCHRHGVLLAVDNAHGAYLRFLSVSAHPIDLGADLCCDSAHKTLPVLTGGAYLHIGKNAPAFFYTQAKNALALFGSTSPSYLILQSLDRANRYLAEEYPMRLAECAAHVAQCRETLTALGFTLQGEECLKLTVCTKLWGYDGRDFARLLREKGIVCEFCDPDFTVFMITPEITKAELQQFLDAMRSIPPKEAIHTAPPPFHKPEMLVSPRTAMLTPQESVPVSESVGRILAQTTIGCPPAIPIAICGERIDEKTAACFAYYGIDTCTVMKSNVL